MKAEPFIDVPHTDGGYSRLEMFSPLWGEALLVTEIDSAGRFVDHQRLQGPIATSLLRDLSALKRIRREAKTRQSQDEETP